MLVNKLKEFDNLTLLAIDYGSKVVGTAKYTVGKDPYPLMLEKIIVKDEAQVIKAISNLINDEVIDVIIVGVPYFIDGKESEQTKKINNSLLHCLKNFLSLKYLNKMKHSPPKKPRSE